MLTFTFLFTKLLSTSLNTAATNLERAWLKIFMAIRLILVCKNGPAKEAYLLEAQRAGIEVDTVESFGELMKSMITNTYQGVMIDLVTSVKASREEKGLAQDVLDAFPVIQLKWDPESKSMRTIAGGSLPDNCTLADFVSRECKLFVPRAVRLSVRKNVYFNVLISRTENMDPASTHRGMTVNVLKMGAFYCPARTGHLHRRSGLSSMNSTIRHRFREKSGGASPGEKTWLFPASACT